MADFGCISSISLDVLSAAFNRGLHHDEARMNKRADLVTNPAIPGPGFPSEFGSKFQSERSCDVCGCGAQLRCVQVEVCAIGVRNVLCVVCCKSGGVIRGALISLAVSTFHLDLGPIVGSYNGLII